MNSFKLHKVNFLKFFIFILLFVFLFSNFNNFIKANETCDDSAKIEEECASLSPTDCRKFLEECQAYFEEKISEIEKDVAETEQQKKTLQNQISVLKNKIKNLEYKISQLNLTIKELSFQIEETESLINDTSLRIENSKEKLIEVLRSVNEEDQKSFFEIYLSEETLSGFFDHMVALETLNSKSKKLLQNIKDLKVYLEGEKQSLDGQKQEMEKLLILQKLQKTQSEEIKKEKDYYLELTEAEYQKKLKEKEEVKKRAAEIRSRIFELIGVPEAPTFGEAYEIAKFISGITGVRPEFLLAVLTQESRIGKNVGQCYLKDPKTGAGVNAKTGKEVSKVMKPDRDIEPFLAITKELGRDPFNTLVSCPMSFGWGGAMGPAQFIPSTWMRYREKVSKIIEKSADPWAIKDSFLAAALYLADYGAAEKTSEAEWKAAMIYFSGTTNIKYRFYGDSVMAITSQYEKDIEAIEKASE